MLLSKKYLSSRLNNFDIDNKTLERELNNLGIEVENVKSTYIKGLKFGKVIECDKIPETKLSKTIVDLGDSKTQILCGCPTIKKGFYVIVATPGTTLPNGMTIGNRKLIGYESNGMICGLDEIGFSENLIPQEWRNGKETKIFQFENPQEILKSYKLGSDANKILGMDDELIEISLTANRNDLNSQESIVKELTMFHSEKRNYKIPVSLDYSNNINVDSEYIKGFASTKIECAEYKSFDLAFELLKMGVKPTLSFQDFLTVLTLNTGVTINGFKDNLSTSDQSEFKVNDLVVGLDYKKIDNPKYLTFSVLDKNYARVISRKLKLSNEYVSKSLKGIDSSNITDAYRYLRHLAETYAPTLKISKLITHKSIENTSKKILISSEYINRLLGTKYTPHQIQKTLSRKYICNEVADLLSVEIPKTRFDINLPVDIAEEVAIIQGYDSIAPVAPSSTILNQAKEENPYNQRIKDACLSFGFDEVVTYNLVNENDNTRWNPFNVEDQVKILKPISSDKEWMRTSLLFQNLRTFDYNKKSGNRNIKLFEIANITNLNSSHSSLSVMCGNYEKANGFTGEIIKTDFFYLKSLFLNIVAKLGLKNNFTFEKMDEEQQVLHPNKSAYIKYQDKLIGYIGEVHPFIREKYFKGINVMEINIDSLMSVGFKKVIGSSPSPFPVVKKDFSFFLPSESSVEDLFESISKIEFVKEIEVFDLFEKESEKSIAFSIFINSQDKTFTNEELKKIETKVTNLIVSKNGSVR